MISSLHAPVRLLMTRDHVASDPEEAARIEALGGAVTTGGGGERRVNGGLAVTRSLGDRPFKPFTSAEPHVAIHRLDSPGGIAEPGHGAGPVSFEFLVVATDGLWDVMSSDDVVAYVKAKRQPGENSRRRGSSTSAEAPAEKPAVANANLSAASWQSVSTALTHEALLRGSLDNVGVCVVDLKQRAAANRAQKQRRAASQPSVGSGGK